MNDPGPATGPIDCNCSTESSIADALLQHVQTLKEWPREGTVTTPLLDSGILDSLLLVSLASFVERHFQIQFQNIPDPVASFATLLTLAKTIHDLRSSRSEKPSNTSG